jgi:flagellin-like protein
MRRALSRKGISPLIATVLLLAFAVAIGTMAVSYVLDATKASVCENVALSLERGTNVCFSAGRVSLVVVNRGSEPIGSALIRVIGEGQSIEERRMPLDLAPGSATKINFEYQSANPVGAQVVLVPILAGEEELEGQVCADRELVTTITEC